MEERGKGREKKKGGREGREGGEVGDVVRDRTR